MATFWKNDQRYILHVLNKIFFYQKKKKKGKKKRDFPFSFSVKDVKMNVQ